MRIWQGFKKIETFNQMVTLKCLDKTRKPPFKMFRPPLMGLRPPFKVFKYSYNALKLTDKVLWFWAVFFLSTSAQADLEGELDKMFNDLHNTTRPKAYMTERRGVISGGSIVQRNYIRDLNPITMTATRIEAGCGGIDLYGGSFSYINKDEFVNFLRQVAQNARGYAFSIALSSMCEKCFQHMETLQRKVMALNTYFGNSCQLAQGVVNDTLGAFDRKGLNDASLIGQFKGMGDLFELSTDPAPKNVYAKATEASPEYTQELAGNVMWQMLLKNEFFKRDPALTEAVMSMVGTIITSKDGSLKASAPGGLVTLRDLVEGGAVRSYHCDTLDEQGCLNLSVAQVPLKGLAFKIEETLLGPSLDGTQGIVGKLGQNNGAFSAEEITFINALPPGAFARIRTLASLNVGGTVSLVEAQARILALTMVKSMALSYLTQAEASLKLSGHAYAQIAREQIKTSRESIEREAQELTQSYGTNKDILELYELLLRASQVNTYLESTALE